MTQTTIECNTCEGTGKLDVVVVDHGQDKVSSFKITCHDCNGTGKQTSQQQQASQEFRNMWCTCGGEAEHGVTYYADGQHPKLKGHHYRCNCCGNVTQIG